MPKIDPAIFRDPEFARLVEESPSDAADIMTRYQNQTGLMAPGPSVPTPEEEALIEPQPMRFLSSLTPQTTPELMGDVALTAATSGTINPLTSRLARAGVRMAAPTIAAGVTGAMTGLDPMIEGAKAFAGTSIPEILVPSLKGAGRFISSITSRSQLVKEGIKGSKDLYNIIKEAVPAFKRIIPERSQNPLEIVLDPNMGKALLKGTFQAADDAAARAFGEPTPIIFPIVKQVKGVDLGLPGGMKRDRQLTIRHIQDALKKMKAVAADFQNSANPADRVKARDLLDKTGMVEQKYRDILHAKDPNLLIQYDNAVNQYRDGLQIIGLLKESQALRPSERGPWIDRATLGDFLTRNINDLPPTDPAVGAVWKFVEGKAGPGTRATDVITKFSGPRILLPRALGGSGPAGAANLPAILRLHKAGKTPKPLKESTQAVIDMLGLRGIEAIFGEQQ